ncbi:MANSC domain-containing protein 1 [Xiphophorus couchianus]|uniref:MANSC domain-containing protein 1 n=1 Tax=Xiphophorus couchianus TaxID=32473 RepID=UPI001016A269|nr:MANSC domain-containing protein 1 [Xiphophorus couchianus]XP_027900281.1 MANSC domain-containing protein 1 [Xiphophorus couchianus]XP_027900282.1 MANSC domain-containing protein 1 [Xiphophorus couchianus]
MTPPADLRPLPGLLVVMLLMSLPAAALEPETCFSRQHQGAAINVRAALSRDAVAMMARTVRSERDCVLACCSEEVQTGARCNMAVFKANKHAGEDNCLLFHCPTESDCPLMKAAEGSNTYDIYKGLSHPPTLRPVPMTTTLHTTSTSTSTTSAPTTPTTSQPTSTTSTPTTAQALHSTPEPSPPIIIIATEPAGTPPTNTTTSTTTMGSSPTFTTRKPNKTSKKQNKTIKKGKSHPALTTTTTQTAPSSMTSLPAETGRKEVEDKHTSVLKTTTSGTPTTVAPTTSTTSTTTTATTTTATFPITTTTLPPTTTTTTTTQRTSTTEPTTTVTAQPPSLIFIPKDPVQSEPDLQPGHPTLNSSSSRGKAVAAQGALKGGVVAFMVLALAVLTLALAVGGRKAVESFDRRHYTRLELNDLHYEI